MIASPRFAQARLDYIDAVLALYEADPSMVELMRDAGRIMIYGIVMCLWGAYRPDLRETWPTIGRLKAEMAPFDVASDRQIDIILARLSDLGLILVERSAEDSRLRIVLPTPRMVDHDLEWLRAHYVPLGTLYRPEDFAAPLSRDVGFHPTLRAASLPLLPLIAKGVMSQNKPMMRILHRAVGMLTLMKLVQILARHSVDGATFTDLGRLFGVSRTHIRQIFASSATERDVMIEGRGRWRFLQPLLGSFDRLIADGMIISREAHAIALRQIRAPTTK